MALSLKFPTKLPLKSPKIAVVNNLTVIWGFSQEEAPPVPAYTLYISKNYSQWPTFLPLILWCIFIQICTVGSKGRIFSATECVLAVQSRSRSSKVDDFGTNRKQRYDFLLVGHWDYSPILHRFWDTATYWLKIAYFSYHSFIWRPPSPRFLWNFAAKLTVRMWHFWQFCFMKLSSSEDCMILAGVVLAWYQRVSARRSDGGTDCRSDGQVII